MSSPVDGPVQAQPEQSPSPTPDQLAWVREAIDDLRHSQNIAVAVLGGSIALLAALVLYLASSIGGLETEITTQIKESENRLAQRLQTLETDVKDTRERVIQIEARSKSGSLPVDPTSTRLIARLTDPTGRPPSIHIEIARRALIRAVIARVCMVKPNATLADVQKAATENLFDAERGTWAQVVAAEPPATEPPERKPARIDDCSRRLTIEALSER